MGGASRGTHGAGNVVAAAAVLAALVTLFLVDPATSGVFPPCPLHALTGLDCPGCGSLRAVHHLLHGRISAAASLNPLLVASVPLLALLVLRPAWTHRRWVPWAALAILVGYGIARNLPVWPFVLLAPR